MGKLFNEYKQKNPSSSGSEFLENTEVKKTLSEIKHTISFAFKVAIPNKVTDNDSKDGTDPFIDEFKKNFDPFLSQIKLNNSYLMVRSSGDEDSSLFPNAGGNLSETYVAPDLDSVLTSIARVIGSYVDPQSLKNRMEADVNPFNSPLNFSALLQELIGEPIGGAKNSDQIPKSLVMFTTEPNFSEQDFCVTTLSTVYGHGEGVVNNQNVKSDTIYVVSSEKNCLECYQNHIKSTRLVPQKIEGGKIGLKLVENPNNLKSQRVLDKEIVEKLFNLAKEVEKECGAPMDMEIVIKGNEIYVVQMRPVVRPQAKPSYLSIDESEFLESIQASKILVPGFGSVVEIDSKDQILICKHLREAERLVKDTHRLVIVEDDEPANSHPVVNFSRKGMLCLKCDSLNSIQNWVNKIPENKYLAVCSQSGKLALFDTTEDRKNHAQQGYYYHPANISISLDEIDDAVNLKYDVANTPKDVLDAMRALKEASTNEVALKIINHMEEGQIGSISKQVISLKELEKECEFVPVELAKNIKRMEALEKKFQEILTALKLSYTSQGPRLEKCFLIKSLSALISQEKGLNTYSLMHLGAMVKKTKEACDYQKKFPFRTQLNDLISYADICVNKEDKELWSTFLTRLEPAVKDEKISKETVAEFHALMQRLEEFGALSQGMHFILLPALRDVKEGVNEDFLKKLSANPEDLLEALDGQKQAMQKISDKIDDFGQSEKIDAAWKDLQSIMDTFKTQKFFKCLSDKSSLVKILAIQSMSKLSELVDNAIKGMKLSDLNERDQLKYMKEMVKADFELTKKWAQHILNDKDINQNTGGIDSYFKVIEKVLEKCCARNDLNDLDASSDFSVSSATFSSKTAVERHLPNTLEDIFTLNHQNKLNGVAKALNQLLPENPSKFLNLPPIVQKVLTGINKLKDKYGNAPQIFGIDFTKTGMLISCNLALENHSLVYKIEYNTEEDKILLHLSFFGQCRGRWGTIGKYVKALDSNQIMELVKGSYSRDTALELNFSWIIKEESLEGMIEECQDLINLTHDGEASTKALENLFSRAEERKNTEQIGKWYFENSYLEDGYHGLKFVAKYLASKEAKELIKQINDNFGTSEDKEILSKQLIQLYRIRKYYSYLLTEDLDKSDYQTIFNYTFRAIMKALPRFKDKDIDKRLFDEILIGLKQTRENRYSLKITENNHWKEEIESMESLCETAGSEISKLDAEELVKFIEGYFQTQLDSFKIHTLSYLTEKQWKTFCDLKISQKISNGEFDLMFSRLESLFSSEERSKCSVIFFHLFEICPQNIKRYIQKKNSVLSKFTKAHVEEIQKTLGTEDKEWFSNAVTSLGPRK